MQVVKRISDSVFVGTVNPPMTIEQEILLNVIPNFGGIAEDYEVVEYEPSTPEPQPQEPSMEDYLIDLDFRLCMIELGL